MEDKRFIDQLRKEYADALIRFVNDRSASQFIETHDGKWSVGQNIDHLIKSLSPVNLALQLPKVVLRLLFGKPNRNSRTYHELVARYHQKLAAGGQAPGRFMPPKITWEQKENLTAKFIQETTVLSKRINSWQENQLDRYLLPHPLLGKITVREMLYFSVYHLHHHLLLLQQRAGS